MHSYIPHNALIYLLLSLAFILVPHFERAPFMLPVVWLAASFWQYKFFKQQWLLPLWPVKAFLILLALGSIWLQFNNVLSLEFVTQLLLMTLLLKLLEMKTQRDVLIVLYLSYFSIVTQLLFSQSIIAGLYVLLALTAITACLISLYQQHAEVSVFHPLKLSIKMTAISVPLLVIAFIVFPRLDPFWSVPSLSPTAKTGISDNMSPGSIGQLLESNELALRVIFEGDLPDKSQLYWRTLVLDYFDGEMWIESPANKRPVFTQQLPKLSEALDDSLINNDQSRYTIIQEATQQPWLFHLDLLTASEVGQFNTYTRTLSSKKPLTSRIQYRLISQNKPQVKHHQNSQFIQRKNTQLPLGFNPKTIEFAQQLRQKFTSDLAFINAILAMITQENFYYTLTPPLTGKHSVDDFWFSTRRGLCEHYSQALVVILRAANIPARVVTGYHGGFLNPYDDYVMIRQKDAHAWVEALIDDEWQRFDPTAAISPSRVETSADDLVDNTLLGQQKAWGNSHSGLNYLLKLQLKWDQVNFFWQQKILNFDSESQLNVLSLLLGSTNYLRLALFISASFFGFAALFFLVIFYLQRKKIIKPLTPLQKIYQRFIKKLKFYGVDVKSNEGAVDLSKRLQALDAEKLNVEGAAMNAKLKRQLNTKAALSFLDLYIQLSYKPQSTEFDRDDQLLKSMKRYLKSL